MTEIKFRAWSKEAKVMHPSWKRLDDDGSHILMQFSGVLDKQGKEIYEGDILKTFDGKYTNVVVFKDGIFGVEMPGTIRIGSSVIPLANQKQDQTVVGNIYENRELLK